MLYAPTDCLAYHNARVIGQHRDMSNIPLKDVCVKAKAFYDNQIVADSSKEAIRFYALNHGMALLAAEVDPFEPLSAADLSFVRDYHKACVDMARRCFYYLMLITTRESRHHHGINNDFQKAHPGYSWLTDDVKKYSDGPQLAKHLLNHPPAMTVGEFVRMTRDVFRKSKFSGGYGGEKWAKIGDCLVNFVDGTYSATQMLDTAWTLAHNGGPCFDKGMLYGGQNAGLLLRILDVQRGGQIPEAVHSDPEIGYASPIDIKASVAWLRNRFPGKLGDFVDWMKVVQLGAVGSYLKEINAQQMKDPEYAKKKAEADAQAKAVYEAQKAKAKAELEAAKIKAAEEAAKALEEANKKWYFVDHLTKVEKFEPVREAA